MSQERENNEDNRQGQLMDFLEARFAEYERGKDKKKKDHEYNYKGNRKQAEFNEEVLENLKDIQDLVKSGSINRSGKLIKETITKIEKRNKCIKLADRSVAGWDTVKEYLSDELASDSDDEKKMRKAEERAVSKKRKGKKDTLPSVVKRRAPTSTITRPPEIATNGRPDRPNSARTGGNLGIGGYSGYGGESSRSNDQCFRCGRYGHHRKDCYARTTVQRNDQ